MRIYNKVSICYIISCNIRNVLYVARLALALAAIEALMILPDKLASGYVEYL